MRILCIMIVHSGQVGRTALDQARQWKKTEVVALLTQAQQDQGLGQGQDGSGEGAVSGSAGNEGLSLASSSYIPTSFSSSALYSSKISLQAYKLAMQAGRNKNADDKLNPNADASAGADAGGKDAPQALSTFVNSTTGPPLSSSSSSNTGDDTVMRDFGSVVNVADAVTKTAQRYRESGA